MPTYNYQCEKCGKVKEERRKIADRNITKECACSGGFKRLQSSSSFILKGTGYYQTDFKNK